MKEAQAYAEHGMALVPIPFGKKGPVLAGWNEVKQTIKDPHIAAALTGNIGIAHAYCTPRTAAIDVDDLARATSLLAQYGIDLGALRNAPDSVEINSGRDNRAKLLYRLHDDMPVFASKVLKEGGNTILELRCATSDGRTVQDVLPPSIHPNTGQPYQWAGNGTWSSLPVLPMPVVALWQSLLRGKPTQIEEPSDIGPMPDYLRARLQTSKATVADAGATLPETLENIAKVESWLAAISATCSYEQWRNTVWAIRDLLGVDGKELARKWSATAPSQFNATSFEAIWNSFKNGGGITWRSLPFYAGQSTTATSLVHCNRGTDPSPTAPPEWVAELNTRYALVRHGSKLIIVDFQTPSMTGRGLARGFGILDVAAFRATLNGRFAPVQKAGDKQRSLADAWLAHPQRRQYEGLVYAPGEPLPSNILNLWQGFAVAPVAGDVSPWLEVLAALVPNEAERRYVLRWLAWRVQNVGGIPDTILIFQGAKGTGKNSLFDPLLLLFGPHAMLATDPELIAGRFTFHLMYLSFAVLDEAVFIQDPRQADRIKARVTAKVMHYEQKGMDPVSGVNRCAYVMLTNHDYVWQASSDERRAVVIEVGEALRGNLEFWQRYHAWATGEGPPALLHFLQSVDLTGFNPRAIPRGEALRKQVEQTALRSPAAAWWYQCLTEGAIRWRDGIDRVTHLDDSAETEIDRVAMRLSYEQSASGKYRNGSDWSSVAKRLISWAGPAGIRKVRARHGTGREWRDVLPPLPALRAAFTAATQVEVDA